MPVMEISIVPLGTGSSSVSKYVAEALKILGKQKGLNYRLTSMGTIVEGNSLDELLDLAKRMHRAVLNKGINRIVTNITIDDRRDKKLTIEGKMKSVVDKMET